MERSKQSRVTECFASLTPEQFSIRDAEGTVDAELVRLLDRVYEANPDDRASAKEIVVALEQLLEKVLAKSESVGGDSIEQAMKKKTSKSELRSWFK